jgi:signal transduction histidine kinase
MGFFLSVLVYFVGLGLPQTNGKPDLEESRTTALQRQLDNAPADSTRSRILYQLGRQRIDSHTDSSLYFFEQSLRIAERGHDSFGAARAMYWLADIHYFQYKDEARALYWLRKTVALAKSARDHLHLAKSFELLALVAMHQRIGSPQDLLTSALSEARKAGDWETLAHTYTSLSYLKESLNDYEAASAYTLQGMKLTKAHNLDMWFTYGLDYCELQEKRGQHAQAMSMAHKLDAEKKKLPRSEGLFVYTNDLARLALLLRSYNEAEAILTDGLKRENKLTKPDSLHLFHYYTTLINLHIKQGDFQKAFQRSTDLSEVRLWLQRVRQTRDSKLQMTQLKATIDIENKEREIAYITVRQQQQYGLLIGVSLLTILLIGFVIVLRRSQQRIKQQSTDLAKLNGIKDQLFSIVSHDLRGPVINLQQSLDRLETASAITLPQILPRFRQSVNAVAALTDNILCWSLAQMGGLRTRPQPVDLQDIVTEVLTLYADPIQQKDLIVSMPLSQLPALARTVVADENQVEIVLRNLVQNAIKFSPAGGQLRFEVEAQQDGLSLLIQDEGPGFAWQPAHKGTRPSQGSTGLGLTVVEDLMNRNGGTLQINPRTDRSGMVVRLMWQTFPSATKALYQKQFEGKDL